MARWTRWRYWRAGLGRRMWVLWVVVPIALLNLFAVIQQLAAPEDKPWLAYIPSLKTYWYLYVISLLVATIFVLFVSAPAATEERVKALRKRHVESFRRYRQRTIPSLVPTERSQALASLSDQEALERRILTEIESKFELKKRNHHITRFAVETLTAHNDANGVIVRGEAHDGKTFDAFIVQYSNKLTHRIVAAIPKVSFELSYCTISKGRSSVLHIHRGAWLDEKDVELDFSPNCPPHLAVLATIENGEVFAVRRDSDSSYRGLQAVREKLVADLYNLHINFLTNSQNSGTSFTYIFEITRDPIRLNLVDAILWKSSHLSKFTSEGFKFSMKLHEIWRDAQDKFPPSKPDPSISWLRSGPQEPARLSNTWEQLQAFEKEQEEQLVPEIKDWERRAADFIELHVGKDQQEKFLGCLPSIDDGLARKAKPALFRVTPALTGKGDKPKFTLPYWQLSEAVSRRTDKLMEIQQNLS